MHHNAHIKQRIKSFMMRADIQPVMGDFEIFLLAQGGSDRCFYRVKTQGGSYIVMTNPASGNEVQAYVAIGKFLFTNGIGAPKIIAINEEEQLVLLEDLGDHSLYQVLKQAQTRQEVIEHYKKTLIFLAEMQIKATSSIENCSELKHRCFGYKAFRGETEYFVECFMKRFCGIPIVNKSKLEDEAHRLAFTLDKEPRYFMHRDFQSQNIFLKESKVRITDFQTATQGLLQYDLVSLLKDAYFVLSSQERDLLVHFYIDTLETAWAMPLNRNRFIETFHLTGLQRNMQALGAFAFLSMNKGKTIFLQYIPAAFSYLKDALDRFSEFSELKAAVEMAEGSIQNKTFCNL